jgi:oxygen-dependent protoporphyrinogen oxidase
MDVLTSTIAEGLGNRVRLETPVQGVSYEGGRYTVHASDGDESFDTLVMASPAYAQAGMLKDLDPGISGLLDEIPYPALAVICLGYRREDVGGSMDGFGFLVPSGENRDILGTVADSYVFPNRAPEGHVLLRTMVGGARRPELAELPDEKLSAMVRANLREIMGVKAEPVFAKIYRHEKAIPQYLVGHARRLDEIGERLSAFPGLELTGNAFLGVSLNDCVLNAERTAERIVDRQG